MSLAPGQHLSHYRLVEPIGEGGMGVVWRATDTTLGRDVAVKVLPPAFAEDPERMARFEREARLLASLNHPGIAAIYGVGVADGVRFLAMELVEGDDLAVRLSRGAIPVVESLELARQVAAALEAAHEKGVIHRDLKPANVKATPDGQVKLLDFGLAKALEGEADASGSAQMSHSPTITSPMTAANVILGTAAYMSPEQARGKPVDRRADIWAFGCLLFECLAGQRAFVGETVSDTLAKILEREPDLAKLPAGTPARVRELLQRCFAKDARLRLRDIGDARIVLDEVLATRSSSGRLPVVQEAPGGTAPRRRGPFVAIAAALVVGLALGAALWGTLARGPRAGAGAEVRCLSIEIPSRIRAGSATFLAADGRTLVVLGQPVAADGTVAPESRAYTRASDGYEFKEIAGTAGLIYGFPDADGRDLVFLAPVAPGSARLRLARVPLDGSAPPTAIADWKDAWTGLGQMENGDLMVREGMKSFVRLPRAGGAPSAPIEMDAGRAGVSRYELGRAFLPGGRGELVDVVLYDARGWHYSVGLLEAKTGKVRILDDDGGNARYLPTGQLVFSRGDAILAAPFDLGRLEMRGAPVAIWSGLRANATYVPGPFDVTRDGALVYQPGQLGSERPLVLVDAAGRVSPWSSTPRALNFNPRLSPDGRRFVSQFINSRGIDELWVSPVDHDDLERVRTEPNADCFFPSWSPDGRRLAYRRMGKDDKDGLYVVDIESGEPRRILAPEAAEGYYDANCWAPDGGGLLLTHVPLDGATGIAFLPAPAGAGEWGRPHPVVLGDGRYFLPQISPDGRFLAFQSDESGKQQSYVIAFHAGSVTGRAVPIRTTGSAWHQWSTDGTMLFVQDERNRLLKVPVTAGPTLTAGTPVEICDLEKARAAAARWAVLPDGRILVGQKNANEEDPTHLNVVLNWTTLLKRRMAAGR